MPEETPEREVVYESALQLWAAAQTDFDPYQVPPSEWTNAVPVRDADIAIDLGIEVDEVRAALRELDGQRLVVEDDDGRLVVRAPVPEDTPL